MPNINTFDTEQDWIQSTQSKIESLVSNLQSPTISLSGGSTPRPIYQAMKTIPNIKNSHIYQVDERYVPNTSEQSNQRLIRETLAPTNAHYINTTLPIEEAIENYEQLLPKQFDLMILGIGEDGHIASLFPNSPALSETTRQVVHTTQQNNEDSSKNRITLTFPSIMNSKTILLLLRGKQKKSILDQMLNSDKLITDLPAKKLLHHPNLHIHYLTA